MLRRFATLFTQPCRTFKSDLKLKWLRPPVVQCYDTCKSGDLEPALPPARSEIALPFSLCDAIRDQPDSVKAIFSVGHAGDSAALQIYRQNLIDRVKKHKYDENSMEVKIAKMTGRIRGMQVHLEQFPRDGRTKNTCKELIDKRKKFIKYLRRWDYKRFEWLLEKLQLEYKPAPPPFRRITRKQSMTKLKELYCEEIKEKRMNEYKLELIAQRDALLKHYAENPLPPLKKDIKLD